MDISSLLVSTVSGRVGSFSTLAVSSFSGNNMDISSLLVSTVSGRVGSFSTMAVSSLTGNNVSISSLSVLNMSGNNGSLSNLAISSLTGNNVSISSLSVLNMTGNNGSFSTLTGSIATQNGVSLYTLPTVAVSTLAGGGVSGTIGGLNNANGTNALFSFPWGVVLDSSSNLYVADSSNNTIRMITPQGNVTTFASGFNSPCGIALDSSNNIYVADSSNHKIRMISPLGNVTTLAGGGLSGSLSGSLNGNGTNALFSNPRGVAVDSLYNVYVADTGNYNIRKITPGGAVSTLAGAGFVGNTNGKGTNAEFRSPSGVAVDSLYNVYVTDIENNNIRKITAEADVTTFTSVSGGPLGITVDSINNIYVSAAETIRKITPGGAVTILAGGGNSGITRGFSNGNGTNALFSYPRGIVVDSFSNIYVGDSSNNQIRKITQNIFIPTYDNSLLLYGNIGINCNAPQYTLDVNGSMNVSSLTVANITGNVRVSTITGNNGLLTSLTASTIRVSGDISTESFNTLWAVSSLAGGGASGSSTGTNDGIGTNALFNNPIGVAIDSLYNMYLADTNNKIRKITPQGVVTTLAGGGSAGDQGGSADGNGTNALFSLPEGVAVDSSNNVYVADTANCRIRKITPGGVVTTFAGSSQGSDDGNNGTSAKFNFPGGLTIDSRNNIYVADTNSHTIRIIYAGGAVSTLAGGGGSGNANGNGTNAKFDTPRGIAADSRGNVYVADSGGVGHKIRIIYPGGAVSTLAGSTPGFANGNGTNARFDNPRGVAVDSNGNVYVADNSNRRIRIIYPGGAVSTLVGDGTPALLNGNGTNARFQSLKGIALDPTNNLYVSQDISISKITQGIFKYNYIAGSLEGISFYTGLQNTVLTTSNLSMKIISASNPDTLKVFGGINATQAIVQNSDRRIKANIETIHGALDKISSLTGVYYNRIDGLDFSSLHMGLIAQDVEQVLPEVVMTDSSEENKKSIAYGNIVAVLIEGIKELTGRVETLESQVVSLQSMLYEFNIILKTPPSP